MFEVVSFDRWKRSD